MTRKIIHLDLDAFYCAVEEQRNPSLRGKPFAVGGSPNERGVVASCSYAARNMGVRSAMPMSRAKRLCPELIIVAWHKTAYGEKSRQVMDILKQLTENIEQLSIDEAFLDVTDLNQSAEKLARQLQQDILKTTGLPCSLGIAANKLIAKIASGVGKAMIKTNTYPNAIQVVPPGAEAEFLAPLPVETLWGVGPKMAARLNELGIRTIGDIAKWPEADLARRFGSIGYDIGIRAKGIDKRAVVTHRDAKSYSQEITFNQDTADEAKLIEVIQKQSGQIGKSLKNANLLGSTVKIKLRWSDFTTITRQVTLPDPTNDKKIISKKAIELFQQNWKTGQLIRLLGVGVSNIQAPSRQLSLWDSPNLEKQNNLNQAIDKLKERFGDDVISRGIE